MQSTRIIVTHYLFPYTNALFSQSYRFGILTQLPMITRRVVQCLQHLSMLWTKFQPPNLQGL